MYFLSGIAFHLLKVISPLFGQLHLNQLEIDLVRKCPPLKVMYYFVYIVSSSADRCMKVWKRLDSTTGNYGLTLGSSKNGGTFAAGLLCDIEPHQCIVIITESSWICICTLAEYHDRDIYHVDW